MKIILSSVFTILASLIFGSQVVFADDSITLSISPNVAELDLMPGNYGYTNQTLTVSTTNPTGYKITMETTGTSTALVETSDPTLTIPTFTLESGQTSIPVADLGYGYGYSLDGGSTYYPVPALSTVTKIFSNNTAGTSTHTLTFGAKINVNTTAGTYANSFILYATANLSACDPGYICYYGNGDDGTGTMDDQFAGSNTETYLIAPNYSRSGYGFAGWNTEPDGGGTNYGPSQTITTGDLSEEGLRLYANWVASAGNLQGWQGCDSMNSGDVTALTDTRDGNTYAVAKHPDNQCWMMENLRLDLSNSQVGISDLSTNKPTAAFATAANNHPASTNNFCESTSPNAACVNQLLFNTNNTNRSLTASYDANDDSSSWYSWYSYGNYYNWYTATAGNGTYSFSTAGASVEGDICPAGWHLPSGYEGSGDLSKLDILLGGNGRNQSTAASSNRWRSYPLNFIFSGEQRGSTGHNRDVSGGYATRNTSNSQRAINFWLQKTAINIYSNSNLKPRGQSVRCIASETYSVNGDIHYDSNGGSGTMADQTNTNLATAVAANNAFTKQNAEFVSWNTKADGTGTVVMEGGSVANAAHDMRIVEGGTLTLYAIWRTIYSIGYDGNGADAGTMSIVHTNLGNRQELVASNFSKSGYGFAGWSTDPNAAAKLASGQAVTIYGPNERITINSAFTANADTNGRITLYATWLEADANDTLQTFDVTKCSALSVGDVLALTDTRDNDTYLVAKLADNNCWMTENLRFDPSSTTLSNANTHFPTATFITEATTASSATILCNTDDSACIDQILYNNNNLNRNLTASESANNNSSSWYSYGMMYGWYAATAGNGTYAMTSGNVAGDICPTGWRLPTGGNTGEYVALNTAINGGSTTSSAGLLTFPANFIYSGDYNYNKAGGRGSYGRYWSATPNGTDTAYRFGNTATNVTPAGSWNKWDAFAVRCMIKDPTATSSAEPTNNTTEEEDTTEPTVNNTESVSSANSLNLSSNNTEETEDIPNSTSNYSEPLGVIESEIKTEENISEPNNYNAAITTAAVLIGSAGLVSIMAAKRNKEES